MIAIRPGVPRKCARTSPENYLEVPPTTIQYVLSRSRNRNGVPSFEIDLSTTYRVTVPSFKECSFPITDLDVGWRHFVWPCGTSFMQGTFVSKGETSVVVLTGVCAEYWLGDLLVKEQQLP